MRRREPWLRIRDEGCVLATIAELGERGEDRGANACLGECVVRFGGERASACAIGEALRELETRACGGEQIARMGGAGGDRALEEGGVGIAHATRGEQLGVEARRLGEDRLRAVEDGARVGTAADLGERARVLDREGVDLGGLRELIL